MQSELDSLTGEKKTEVNNDGNNLSIEFLDSERVYILRADGSIEESEKLPEVDDAIGLNGEGTKDNPYRIASIEDLVVFAFDVNSGNNYENKFVVLDTDLDFKNDASYIEPNNILEISNSVTNVEGDINYDGKAENIKTELTTGYGFIPIATSGEGFFGVFNGQNHKLKNCRLKKGLFEYNNGLILNLNIENAELEGKEDSFSMSEASALCMNNRGWLLNCNTLNDINVVDIQEFGGICHTNSGIIYNCSNQANINATLSYQRELYINGVCYLNESMIIQSSNLGDITATNISSEISKSNISTRLYIPKVATVSGISYENVGEINGCYNKGKLVGNGLEGGRISGILCYNSGAIFNSYNLGELSGVSKDLTYDVECAEILSENNGTGIVSNCYSIGEISENSEYVSCVVNRNAGNITNCYYLSGSCAVGVAINDNEAGALAEVVEKSEEEIRKKMKK